MGNEGIDLGPIEAHLEQGREDYYLVTLHPTTLKYFADLLAEVKQQRIAYSQLETHARWLDLEMTRALTECGIAREWAYGQDHHEECSCGKESWLELEGATNDGQT